MIETPPSFLCPITLAVFADPVVLVATGQSFERGAIEKHLQRFNTCPATLLRLRDKTFVANHQLRKAIQEFKETQQRMVRIQSALRTSLVALLHCSRCHREMGLWEEAIARCNEGMSIAELLWEEPSDPMRAAVVHSCKTQLLDYYHVRSAVLSAAREQHDCESIVEEHERILQLQIQRLSVTPAPSKTITHTLSTFPDDRERCRDRLRSENELYPPLLAVRAVDAVEEERGTGDDPQEADEDDCFWDVDLFRLAFRDERESEHGHACEAVFMCVRPEPFKLQVSTAAPAAASLAQSSSLHGVRQLLKTEEKQCPRTSRLEVLVDRKQELETQLDSLRTQEARQAVQQRKFRLQIDKALSSVTAEALLNYGRHLLAKFCFPKALLTAQQAFSILSKEIQNSDAHANGKNIFTPASPFEKRQPITFLDGGPEYSLSLSAEDCSQAKGPHSLLLSRILRLVANSLFQVGKVAESLNILQISCTVLKGVVHQDYDDFRLEIADTSVEIGVIQEKLGQYREADLSLQQGLKVQVSLLGWKSPIVANTLDLTAVVARRQGRYSEAAEMYNKSLHARLMLPETRNDDVLIAASFDGLGSTFREQGRHHEAFSLAWSALEVRINVLGKQHPDTISSIEHVGAVLFALGNYQEALAKFDEALFLLGSLYGKRHFRVAQLLIHRGNTFLRMQQPDKALDSLRSSQTYLTECFGEEHVETARVNNSIACTLQRQGFTDNSLRIFEQVLRVRLQKLGNRHKEVADTHYNMARLYMEIHRHAEAAESFICSFAAYSHVFGPYHSEVENAKQFAILSLVKSGVCLEKAQKRLENEKKASCVESWAQNHLLHSSRPTLPALREPQCRTIPKSSSKREIRQDEVL